MISVILQPATWSNNIVYRTDGSEPGNAEENLNQLADCN